MVGEDVETVVLSEVEEAHHLSEAEETSNNIRISILPDMDKILATTNRVMAININNIRTMHITRRRSSINLPSNIKRHLDLMSTLRLAACKLRLMPNPRCNNTDSKLYILLDKTISYLMKMPTTQLPHPAENVHEIRLSAAQTEDTP